MRAQVTPGRTQTRCNGQPVSEIVVRSQAPSFGGIFERSRRAGRLVSAMHVTTSPEVIEHFVLLRKGEPCTALARSESERILRSQPFLADASVTAYADGSEAVRIEVVTVDEPSVVAALGLVNASPYVRALTLGNANVAGKGVYAVATWRQGGFYRDTYLFDYANSQLFGKPWQFAVRGVRRDLGSEWESGISYPLFSDFQRYAWEVAAGASRDYIPFRRPGKDQVSLGTEHHYFDAGGVARFGRPGRLLLAGGSVSGERVGADGIPVVVSDSGLIPDSTAELFQRYTGYRVARINALLGFRSISFLQVTGFDALNGRQDIRRGVQVSTTLGTGLRMAGEPRDKLYAAFDLYAGIGGAQSFAGFQWRAEGRRATGGHEWDGILSGARAAWYYRPQSRHTVMASLAGASGGRQRTPFQLALGDPRGGVRGFLHADVGGGRRIVGRLEERWRMGSFRGTADYGLAFFSDVGRIWQGDAPLAVNTQTVESVGIGLLAAIPPRSQRMWRVEMALPVRSLYGSRMELRFSNDDRTREFWREPNDLRRNRERSVPTSVFSWP
jgi:hypothetical protein